MEQKIVYKADIFKIITTMVAVIIFIIGYNYLTSEGLNIGLFILLYLAYLTVHFIFFTTKLEVLSDGIKLISLVSSRKIFFTSIKSAKKMYFMSDIRIYGSNGDHTDILPIGTFKKNDIKEIINMINEQSK